MSESGSEKDVEVAQEPRRASSSSSSSSSLSSAPEKTPDDGAATIAQDGEVVMDVESSDGHTSTGGDSPRRAKGKRARMKEMLREHKIEFNPLNPFANLHFEVLQEKLAGQGEVFAGNMEKAAYFFGIINVCVTAVLVFGTHQEIMPYWYSVFGPILIGWRYYTYKRTKSHYFLLDTCYWINAFLLIYLWILPGNPKIFVTLFALTHGHLSWAIPLFNNKLVLHSVDAMTSLYIHYGPPLVMFCLRWYDRDSAYEICIDPEPGQDEKECDVDLFWTFVAPLGFFVCQQFLYFVIVQVIPHKSLKDDKSYLTSYRYLKRHALGPVFQRFAFLGPNGRVALYTLLNTTFSILVLLPTIFFYKYFYADLVFLLLVGASAVYNGANYYTFVFQGKYVQKRMEKKRQRQRQQQQEQQQAPAA